MSLILIHQLFIANSWCLYGWNPFTVIFRNNQDLFSLLEIVECEKHLVFLHQQMLGICRISFSIPALTYLLIACYHLEGSWKLQSRGNPEIWEELSLPGGAEVQLLPHLHLPFGCPVTGLKSLPLSQPPVCLAGLTQVAASSKQVAWQRARQVRKSLLADSLSFQGLQFPQAAAATFWLVGLTILFL